MPKPNELIPPQDVLPAYAQGRNFQRAGRRFLRAVVEHGLEPDHRVLERWIGFDEEFIQEAHPKAGLGIEDTRNGAWPGCEASGVGGKDAIVAVKS
jgi:hypothetical protein